MSFLYCNCCCKSNSDDVISLKKGTSMNGSSMINFEERSPITTDHKSLLSSKVALELQKKIPIVLQCDIWECVYNLVHHGSDFASFFALTSGLTHTVIVIETIDGHKFGGFASGEWKQSQEYFGNGTSFVFSIDHNDNVDIFNWTQKNDYLLWASNREIGMGGGGLGFAFTLYDDMNHGQSSSTDTFNNPCLYNPDEHVDTILNALSTVKEESEAGSTISRDSISETKNIVSLNRLSLAHHNENESKLKDELLSTTQHSDQASSSEQNRVLSFRSDSARSLKAQSPFKVAQVQVYGFSSEIRSRKKVPKLSHKLFGHNRPSDVRPSDGR